MTIDILTMQWLDAKQADDLVLLAEIIGEGHEYVQAGGGNISVKSAKDLVVKASGFRLRDCRLSAGFVRVNRAAIRDAMKRKHEIPDGAFHGLSADSRPSIETFLHEVVESRYVIHVHSVQSLGYSISASCPALGPEIGWVPYLKPGRELADAVRRVLASSPQIKAILLQNHGFLTWGDRQEEALGNMVSLNRSLCESAFKSGIKMKSTDEWIKVLEAGILWPDELVYLGYKPFGRANSSAKVILSADGQIENRDELTADEYEVATACLEARQFSFENSEIRYLSTEEIAELLNWDAERFRKAMQR